MIVCLLLFVAQDLSMIDFHQGNSMKRDGAGVCYTEQVNYLGFHKRIISELLFYFDFNSFYSSAYRA